MNAERVHVSFHNNKTESFAAKILLFGEYTLIKGSQGLAVPLDNFTASFHKKNGSDAVQNAFRLDSFYNYLKGSNILSENMDLKKFKTDIDDGVYLKSNIPQGYGVGSSGTLCAAVYAKYAYEFKRKENYTSSELNHLKDIMVLMENFYHGTSSGLDCLVSLLNKSVFVSERNIYELIEKPSLGSLGHFYLYDSGISRKTAAFVYGFLQQYDTNQNYKNKIDNHSELVNSLISNAINQKKESFKSSFYELSRFQYLHFSDMIPDAMKDLWMRGLETKEYLFKLCGAGGGGFFIIYSDNKEFNENSKHIKIN